MRAADLAFETASALGANRMRTFLTVLGIVIGIGAVIAMTALIGGVRNALLGQMGLQAARMVQIYVNGYPLTQSELDRLEMRLADYEFLIGTVYGWGEFTAGEVAGQATVNGVDPRYFEASGPALEAGAFFTQEDSDEAAQKIVIDTQAVRDLFQTDRAEDALGRSVRIAGGDYTVVGVIESSSAMVGGEEVYINAYAPIGTVEQRLASGSSGFANVVGFAREGADIDALIEQTKTEIAAIRGIDADAADENVFVDSMKAVIDQVNSFTMSFQLIGGSVAGISLLVGGIGIMNMMLTNVTERIREIGLRRALGARRGDITAQFLLEAVAVCLTGGVFGIALGYGLSWALAVAVGSMGMASVPIEPVMSAASIGMATGLCVLIGVVFGYYPARRAAKLDPVEALRYQ